MFDSPIFFHKNRVGRVYIGGKLFSAFFGDDSADSYEPEEWIASNVSALNKNSKTKKEKTGTFSLSMFADVRFFKTFDAICV